MLCEKGIAVRGGSDEGGGEQMPKRHRTYKDIIYEGSPPQMINDSKTVLQVIRNIVGQSAAGGGCISFKRSFDELCGRGRKKYLVFAMQRHVLTAHARCWRH